MLKRSCPIAIVGVLLLTLCASSAWAQDNRTVRAGETQALVSGTQPITLVPPTTPLRGTAFVTESATTPKSFALLYSAPATNTVFTETIKYTNPAERTFTVTVTPAGSDEIYNEVFKALLVLFVVAVLLESGLAVFFNWRPFVVYFDGRGVKTPISVVVAWLFVTYYDLDIVTRLVNIYTQVNPPFANHFVGRIITALVVAGGSAGVNNLLVALGFRSIRTAQEVGAKPPKTEGWISVSLNRQAAVGSVDVLIGDPTAGPPVAGTIAAGAHRRSALARLFVRDDTRFPMSGGFAVKAGTACEVRLAGVDQTGKPILVKWGPNTIAAGAIIDLDLTL